MFNSFFEYYAKAKNSILRLPSRSILAQPNMHFRVPCRGDRRAAVTHSSKSPFFFFFRQQISLLKFFFDLPLLEHNNLNPFFLWFNGLNDESIIRYPYPFFFSFFGTTEWQKSNETRDGY